jgi:predicted nucleotidyltransferase
VSIEGRRNLLQDELERFVEVASEEFGAEKVILFGSLARALEDGEAVGEWSDLDLVVVAETERPFYERIKDLLDRVRPRVGVDVFVYTPTEWEHMRSERFFIKKEVLGKGRIVYERAG